MGTTKARSIHVTGKIGFSNHPMIEHFKFLKANTKVTPKMTIPSPAVMHFRLEPDAVEKNAYASRDAIFDDLVDRYSELADALGVTDEARPDRKPGDDHTEGFAQVDWPFAGTWAFSGGMRSGRIVLRTDDRYLSNGNDSGRLDYRYTNPVLGLRWTVQPGWVSSSVKTLTSGVKSSAPRS